MERLSQLLFRPECAALLFAAAVFALDMLTLRDGGAGVFYVLAVMLAARSEDPRQTIGVGAVCCGMLAWAAAAAPPTLVPQHLLMLRLLEAALVLSTGLILVGRQRAAGEIQAREDNLHDITNGLPGAVFQFRSSPQHDYEFSFLSLGLAELVGARPEAAPHDFSTFIEYVEPDDLDGLTASIVAAVDNRSQWTHTFRVRTPDGDVRWLTGSSMPNPGLVHGQLVFNGLLFDATDRVGAERALHEAKHAADLILAAAGEGIFGIDMAGRITFVNPAAVRMLRTGQDALNGADFRVLFADDDAAAAFAHWRKAGSAGAEERQTNEIFKRADQSCFPVDCMSTPIMEGDTQVGAVVVFRDITAERQMSADLMYHATHDELTGLLNRRDFEHRLDNYFGDPDNAHSESVMAYLDLDQFKVINDTCGHMAGDELLRQVALIMEEHLRAHDHLARLGGDEFGIFIQDCSLEHAERALRRLHEAIADMRFTWEGKSYRVGVSIGLVAVEPAILGVAEAFRRADAACYAAKEAGRNRVHVYRDDDSELARRDGEMQWVARINHAIECDEFELYAQRIVPVGGSTADTTHCEVLVRMRDAEGNLVPPGTFLPAAERYGLAPVLDRWVIEHTFAWLARVQATSPADQGAPQDVVNINLSGMTLGDEETLAFIIDQFESGVVRASSVCFEITETAAIGNLSRAMHFIASLRTFGCRFALDDFGSGLSSFAYLRSMPVDYLKIDGIFVRDINDDPTHLAMVRSINEIGHIMGIKTIAEYVENDSVMDKLTALGVDYAQGYHIGMPQPISEILVSRDATENAGRPGAASAA